MHTGGRHLSQILDMLGAAQLDLEEGRVVVNAEGPELPEDHGSVLRCELLVAPVIIERAAEDRVVLGCREPLQGLDAAFELHLQG